MQEHDITKMISLAEAEVRKLVTNRRMEAIAQIRQIASKTGRYNKGYGRLGYAQGWPARENRNQPAESITEKDISWGDESHLETREETNYFQHPVPSPSPGYLRSCFIISHMDNSAHRPRLRDEPQLKLLSDDNPFNAPRFFLVAIRGSFPDVLSVILQSIDDLPSDFKAVLFEKYCDAGDFEDIRMLLSAMEKIRCNVLPTKAELLAFGGWSGGLKWIAEALRDASEQEQSAQEKAPLIMEIADRIDELTKAMYPDARSAGMVNSWSGALSELHYPRHENPGR